MSSKDQVNEIVKDLKEISTEERAELWVDYVRKEINNLMNVYLPIAESCDVNVHYVPHEIRKSETDVVFDKTKADAVLVSLTFKFKDPIE